MASPGTLGNLVAPGEDAVPRRFEDLERKVKELGPSIAESLRPIIADLQAQDAILTAQVAQIAALVNTQMLPDFGFDSASGYAIPAGFGAKVTRASYTHTVPAGYTKALISATAQDSGVNSTAGFDYLSSFVQIAVGYYTFGSSATIPAGYTGASFSSVTDLLTGLTPGSTITVISQPHSYTGSFAANASNSTVVSGTCLFLR